MSILEKVHMSNKTKEQNYEQLLKEAKALLLPSDHFVSRLANACALIQKYFNHHWVGFYLVDDNKNMLYLGPFQGPIACTLIPYDKGVCGSSWARRETLVVDDVHQFPGHIACSSLSNSEIVVPMINDENKVIGVLDIDSVNFSSFNNTDKEALESLCRMICQSV